MVGRAVCGGEGQFTKNSLGLGTNSSCSERIRLGTEPGRRDGCGGRARRGAGRYDKGNFGLNAKFSFVDKYLDILSHYTMGVGAGPLRGPGTCRRVGRGVSASGVTDMGEEEKRANGSWRGIGSTVEIRVPRPRRALPLSASFASARHCRELEMGLTMVEEFSCKIKSRAVPVSVVRTGLRDTVPRSS